MIKPIFAMFDTKSNLYLYPFPAESKGVFLRQLTEQVNLPDPQPGQPDNRSDVTKFSEDFRAFEIGTFDFSTGKFDVFDVPVNLGFASEFKK